jgi:hypothetical protein
LLDTMTAREAAEWRAFHGLLPAPPAPAATDVEDRAARDLMKRFTRGT